MFVPKDLGYSECLVAHNFREKSSLEEKYPIQIKISSQIDISLPLFSIRDPLEATRGAQPLVSITTKLIPLSVLDKFHYDPVRVLGYFVFRFQS